MKIRTLVPGGVAMSFALAGVAWGQDQLPLYGEAITLSQAAAVATAAEAEAMKHGWQMAITVVDPAGNLVLFRRMDQTQIGSIKISIGKARSAALFKRPTKVFEDLLAKGPANTSLLGLAGVVPSQGGIPLIVNQRVAGAIGVSGSKPENDARVADAGARALQASPN